MDKVKVANKKITKISDLGALAPWNGGKGNVLDFGSLFSKQELRKRIASLEELRDRTEEARVINTVLFTLEGEERALIRLDQNSNTTKWEEIPGYIPLVFAFKQN